MEGTRPLNTYVVIGKAVILVFGVIVLGVGLHSHFQSAWAKSYYMDDIGVTPPPKVKGYEMCQGVGKILVQVMLQSLKREAPCPSISMEYYFVWVIILCFLISIGSLAVSIKMDAQSVKTLDTGYHMIAAFLLFVAAIVYIVSSQKIHKLVEALKDPKDLTEDNENWRQGEKVAAGVLTFIWTVLYCFVAAIIYKSEYA